MSIQPIIPTHHSPAVCTRPGALSIPPRRTREAARSCPATGNSVRDAATRGTYMRTRCVHESVGCVSVRTQVRVHMYNSVYKCGRQTAHLDQSHDFPRGGEADPPVDSDGALEVPGLQLAPKEQQGEGRHLRIQRKREERVSKREIKGGRGEKREVERVSRKRSM